MTRWLIPLILFLLFCAPLYADDFVVRPVGNGDLVKTELGWRPGVLDDRTEIGLVGGWMDGIGAGQVEGWLAGIYGTYDLVKEAPLTIASFEVPVTWYIGTMLGVLWPHESEADATAALMTGLNFGDSKIRLGIRGEYSLTDALWSAFADIPDEARLLATVECRF